MADHQKPAPDLVERLLAVRPWLLEVHRELLAAERADMERYQGRLTGAEFLQIVTDSPRVAWLSPLSELIVAIDEALEAEDDESEEAPAAEAGALIDRARALVAPPDGETPFGRRYLVMLQLHPGIVMAHSALVKVLAESPTADPG
jgi:hypothetical protein